MRFGQVRLFSPQLLRRLGADRWMHWGTEMQAMRGRASYTGERSIGTLDAGAVAVAVMFEALADKWQDRLGRSADSGGSGT